MQKKLRNTFSQPISAAMESENLEMVQFLMNSDLVDVNCVSSAFQTPLDIISKILKDTQEKKPKEEAKEETKPDEYQEKLKKRMSELDTESFEYNELMVTFFSLTSFLYIYSIW